jgi:hypothetical protein
MSKRKTPQSEVPRPTHDEIMAKTEFVRLLISKGFLKSQIKHAFRKQFGPTPEDPGKLIPSAGTIEDYLRRAKDQIAERVAGGIGEQRTVLGEVVWGIMSDLKSKNLEKLKAAEIYAKLHGLNAPIDQVVTHVGAVPIHGTVDISGMTEEEKDAILRADAILQRDAPVPAPSSNGHPHGAGPSIASGNGHPDEPG